MDQVSPGDEGSNSQKLPQDTCSNQGVRTARTHAHDPTSSSSSLPSILSPVTKSADFSSIESQSAATLSALSIHDHGESSNSKPLTANTPHHPGQAQDLNLSQKFPTCEKSYQPAQFGLGSFQSVTGLVTSSRFECETLRHVSSESQQQQDSAGHLRLSQGEYDDRALPDWSAVRHGYDPGELFLFNGDGSKDATRKGVRSQVSRFTFLEFILYMLTS